VTISEDESSATDENMLQKTTHDQLIIETSTASYGKGVPGRKNNIGRCEVQCGEHVTFELPKTYTASPKNLLSRLENNAAKWKKLMDFFTYKEFTPNDDNKELVRRICDSIASDAKTSPCRIEVLLCKPGRGN